MTAEVNVRVTASTAALQSGLAPGPGLVQQFADRARDEFGKLRESTRSTMDSVRDDVAGSVRGMAGSFSGLVDVLATTKGGFVALAAVVAGLGFKKAVDETAKMAESAMDLARAMGVSTNEARVWQATMEDLGAGPGELEGAAKGLSRQLRENEADMNKLGLVTRDAAGNLRPMTDLMLDAVEVLGEYKEGTDRALASAELFGRGVDGSSKLMLLNREAIKENEDAIAALGLAVGANAVEAWKDFDAASDRANLSLKGVTKAIGDALMPVMTDLVNMFNAVMPTAITVIRGALGGLAAAWIGVRNGVVVVWETINAMVVTVAEPVRALAEAIGRAMVGDFTGAANAIKGIGGTIAGAWDKAMISIGDSSARAARQLEGIFLPDTQAGSGGGPKGTKSAPKLKEDKAPKGRAERATSDPREESEMPFFEQVLAEEKLAAAKKDALRQYTKQQELDYWASLLAAYDLNEKDRLAITKKVADLEVSVLRDSALQRQALDQAVRDGARASAMAAVEAADIAARDAYDMQQITFGELLELERQHEAQRLEIKRTYLEARRAQIDPERDPVAYELASQQIEEAERQHQQRMAEIRAREAKAQAAPMLELTESMRSGMQGVLAGIGTQVRTLGDLFKGLAKVIWQSLAQAGAKIAADWLMQNLVMKAIGKAMSLGRIGEEAAKAGAGGVASMAAAPWPMNLTAPVFGAAMSAAAMSFAPLASAEGGWDIPAGTTGLMRFHEREMMLPAKHADVIRSLAEDGGPAAAAREVRVQTTSPGEWLMIQRSELVRAIKSAERDGMYRPGRA